MNIHQIRKDVFTKSKNDMMSLVGRHADILDIGGREGDKRLLKKAGNVIVLDRHSGMLKLARRKGFETIQCDLNYEIPLKDNSIDAVVMSNIIEHIVNVDMMISEVWRILKEDGIVYVLTPNLASLHNRILLMFGKLPTCCCVSDLFYIGSIGEGISHRHVRIFTFHSLKRLFELNGFDTILMRGSGFYPDSMGFMSSIMPALSVNIIAVFMKGHIPKNDVKRLLYRELFDNDMEFLRKRLLSRCRCKVCRRGFPGRS